MKRIFYHALLVLLSVMFVHELTAQQSEINVLYIANDEPAAGGDAILIDTLAGRGYNVTALVASAFNEFSHTDFQADMVLFGEALGSGTVTAFANAGYPVPCVSLEGYCVRENRWNLVASNDDFGQILPAEDLPDVISDPTKHFGITVVAQHPITAYAGLTVGQSVDWSAQRDSAAEVTYFTLPQAGATLVADIQGETDLHTLYAYEPDADDATNPFSHRTVIWGVHEFGMLEPEPVFFDLIDGAILWVMGENTVSRTDRLSATRLHAQPNPFSASTQLTFTLEAAGEVTLEVFDLAGRHLSQITRTLGAGEQQVEFQRPATMAAGMYHFRLQANGQLLGSGKMVIEQ